jgi:hypothetical protein
MIFCLVTLHLWGRIFGKFPEIKGLTYSDDGNIIVKLSTSLKLISILVTVFKKDENLVFNINKTKVLVKGTSADHLFEYVKHFLDTDPDLEDIVHHFRRDMFTTEGIEVLGTPVGNDRFIQTFVTQLSQNHVRYRETFLPHRWFRSCSTVEILQKYTLTIHHRKHQHPRLGYCYHGTT